jgi:large subunit ribosomal protein L30e
MPEEEETPSEETVEEETTEVKEEEEAPKKKRKKVVRRRKTRKERENPITTALRLTVESGKVEFGARTGMVAGLNGKAKLFVIAGNTPAQIKQKLTAAAETSKIPMIVFEGSSMELGAVCGKPFPVSVLSVYDAGTSNIMDLAKES